MEQVTSGKSPRECVQRPRRGSRPPPRERGRAPLTPPSRPGRSHTCRQSAQGLRVYLRFTGLFGGLGSGFGFDFGFQESGFGCRASDFGFRAKSVSGFLAKSGFGFRTLASTYEPSVKVCGRCTTQSMSGQSARVRPTCDFRFGFRNPGSEFRVSGFGIRDSGFGIRDSGFGIREVGFGLQVSRFGLSVSGFGFRVSGFWFRPSRSRPPRDRQSPPPASSRPAISKINFC